MKLILYLAVLIINLLFIHYAYGCPNCVAKVTESTPPFFADEFYKGTDENVEQNEIDDTLSPDND